MLITQSFSLCIQCMVGVTSHHEFLMFLSPSLTCFIMYFIFIIHNIFKNGQFSGHMCIYIYLSQHFLVLLLKVCVKCMSLHCCVDCRTVPCCTVLSNGIFTSPGLSFPLHLHLASTQYLQLKQSSSLFIHIFLIPVLQCWCISICLLLLVLWGSMLVASL